jgi:phage FluMu protein Com
MKCPNCKYMHGYEWDETGGYKEIIGEEGEFFVISNNVEMILIESYKSIQNYIYGCPKCKILFMERKY